MFVSPRFYTGRYSLRKWSDWLLKQPARLCGLDKSIHDRAKDAAADHLRDGGTFNDLVEAESGKMMAPVVLWAVPKLEGAIGLTALHEKLTSWIPTRKSLGARGAVYLWLFDKIMDESYKQLVESFCYNLDPQQGYLVAGKSYRGGTIPPVWLVEHYDILEDLPKDEFPRYHMLRVIHQLDTQRLGRIGPSAGGYTPDAAVSGYDLESLYMAPAKDGSRRSEMSSVAESTARQGMADSETRLAYLRTELANALADITTEEAKSLGPRDQEFVRRRKDDVPRLEQQIRALEALVASAGIGAGLDRAERERAAKRLRAKEAWRLIPAPSGDAALTAPGGGIQYIVTDFGHSQILDFSVPIPLLKRWYAEGAKPTLQILNYRSGGADGRPADPTAFAARKGKYWLLAPKGVLADPPGGRLPTIDLLNVRRIGGSKADLVDYAQKIGLDAFHYRIHLWRTRLPADLAERAGTQHEPAFYMLMMPLPGVDADAYIEAGTQVCTRYTWRVVDAARNNTLILEKRVVLFPPGERTAKEVESGQKTGDAFRRYLVGPLSPGLVPTWRFLSGDIAPVKVAFTLSGSPDADTKLVWHFGDGESYTQYGSRSHPIHHTYRTARTCHPTVAVTTRDGASRTIRMPALTVRAAAEESPAPTGKVMAEVLLVHSHAYGGIGTRREPRVEAGLKRFFKPGDPVALTVLAKCRQGTHVVPVRFACQGAPSLGASLRYRLSANERYQRLFNFAIGREQPPRLDAAMRPGKYQATAAVAGKNLTATFYVYPTDYENRLPLADAGSLRTETRLSANKGTARLGPLAIQPGLTRLAVPDGPVSLTCTMDLAVSLYRATSPPAARTVTFARSIRYVTGTGGIPRELYAKADRTVQYGQSGKATLTYTDKIVLPAYAPPGRYMVQITASGGPLGERLGRQASIELDRTPN